MFLASDLDGTLVKDDKIRHEEIEAIKKLRKNGHKFIISTGRSLEGVKGLLNTYDIKYDYLLLCNGSLILDKNNDIIHDKYIDNNIAKDIINEFYDYGNCLVCLDDMKNTILIDNEEVDKSQIIDMFNYFSNKISKEEAINKTEDYKIISVFSTDKSIERAETIKSILQERYSKELEVYRNQFFVDIVPKDCSKGSGLKKILEIEGIDEDSLYVVGDSYNDVSMFRITENSFTFHDVEEAIKKETNNLVNHVSEVVEKIIFS